MSRAAFTLCFALLLPVGAALSQSRPKPASNLQGTEVARFSSSADLVLVPFTVTDRRGAVVNGLRLDQFQVLENGEQRPVAFFAEEDEPVSFGVVFDRSGSMDHLLPIAKESLRRLVALTNPGDEGALMLVSSRPQLASGLTSRMDSLLDGAVFTEAKGGTALNDAIDRMLDVLRKARNPRRALVILSDGMDNHSRRSRGELMSKAAEAGVQIYAVSAYEPAPVTKAVERSEQDRGVLFLKELTARSGGFARWVRSPEELKAAVTEVGRALQSRYVIGFTPPAGSTAEAGQWRKIRVKVSGAGMQTHARPGYRRNDASEIVLD